MGNSIEEDIALIEKSLCDKDTIIQYHYWVGTDFLNAVERIVADYKRVLKKNEQLQTEVNSLKKDISNMYEEEVIISIISDNFNFSRNEVLKLLGGE